jgi:putative copper export protein
MDGETLALVLLSAAKLVTYCAFFGLVGGLAVQLILVPLCQRNATHPQQLLKSIGRRMQSVTVGSAGLLVCASLVRLYAQTYSVFGVDESVTLELLRVVAFETRWGNQWMPQVYATGIVAVAAVLLLARLQVGWWLTASGVVALAITFPLTGHAMSYWEDSVLPWLLQVGHGVAAALWLGTLLAVVVALRSLQSSATVGSHQLSASLVNTFSPVAVGAVSVVLVTGLTTGVFYIEHWNQLWETTYGLVLLGKVLLMLVTGAVGAYNWKIMRPRLGTSDGARVLIKSARLELVIAVMVLTLTAVLVHLPMPHE